MDMKKRLGGRRQIFSAFLPVLAAAALLSGCQRGNPAAVTEVSEESQEESRETEQNSEAGTDASVAETSSGDEKGEDLKHQEKTQETEIVEDSGPLPKADDGGWVENIMLGTDIHYFSDSLTDGGLRFQEMVEYGDGKVVTYIDQITDAFLDEVVKLRPDVLVLSGDLTLNGEKASHKDLAEKLHRVENNGIPVLVIPGNHDINNRQAARYEGEERFPAEYTTPEEFRQIYQAFGYDEAASEDPNSLSYLYELDENTWLLMIDSCQYSPVNKVGGMIKTETYDWIDDQLEKAWEDGVILLPVAHHNLLDESKIYVEDCTIEHSEELVDRLEEEDIPLFLSGHLHVQHYMRDEEDRGIYEIVTSSLSTPPCQYGVLEYRDDETFSYHTQKVDMEKWARKHKSTDENLLNFNTYAPAALKTIFYNQSYDAMKDSEEEETGDIFVKLTKSQKEQMSEVYAQLNAACYGGKAYEIVKEATGTAAYKMWQEYCYPMILFEYLEYIVEDAVKDYNYLEAND